MLCSLVKVCWRVTKVQAGGAVDEDAADADGVWEHSPFRVVFSEGSTNINLYHSPRVTKLFVEFMEAVSWRISTGMCVCVRVSACAWGGYFPVCGLARCGSR